MNGNKSPSTSRCLTSFIKHASINNNSFPFQKCYSSLNRNVFPIIPTDFPVINQSVCVGGCVSVVSRVSGKWQHSNWIKPINWHPVEDC